MGKKDQTKIKKLKKNKVLLSFYFLLIVCLFFFNFIGILLSKDKSSQKIFRLENSEELKELNYWYQVVSRYPEYIVGWLEIIKLESKRGNFKAAKTALDFAEEIDPNNQELTKIKKQLLF